MTASRHPLLVADGPTMLVGFLEHYRDTLRRQCDGLSAEQLDTRLGPSTLTLGSLLKHLAFVENYWFRYVLIGADQTEPWASADWDADPDWELTSAAGASPGELRRVYDAEVDASDQAIRATLSSGGVDAIAARPRHGKPVTLRWILVHMIEEYARHCGHADLIRESIDGAVDL